MAMRSISVCVSDIPKEKVKKSDKNQKSYVTLIVEDKREVDQFGNDLSVSISLTKEERAAGVKKTYVGSGKTYADRDTGTAASSSTSNNSNDDLPW